MFKGSAGLDADGNLVGLHMRVSGQSINAFLAPSAIVDGMAAGTWRVEDVSARSTIQVAGPDYVSRSLTETGIPNVVTSVLASYRGYDTLGETTVIFTAGIAVFLLLKRSASRAASDNKK